MRAPETEATGTAGASEVAGEFQRLGWGATENVRHDLGTDLFLQVRDERRFDLGLIVGVQVKAGPSYFEEPEYDENDEVEGWWFRDSDGDHIDAWLSHTLPHLVVLRDMDGHLSYWAHVTTEAVVSTGKGAKLLVPRAQTVSAEQREALLEVAKTQRPGVSWEGSIWTAGSALTPHQLLRHALLVPRLVAPHPNAGVTEGLSPEQAIAIVMQGRQGELARFAEKHHDVPDLSEAAVSGDWRWRFAAALDARLSGAGLNALLAAIDDGPSSFTRAAATAAAAAALVEVARPDNALDLLNTTLARDDSEPIEHAWLLMQRARASAEIGRLEEARADALAVLAIRNAAPHDATATALAGTAANLLFSTSAWGRGDLEQAITGSDTAASWWRQQTTARGLGAIVDRAFKAWARDTTVTVGAGDVANDELFAASLLASHLGNQPGWRELAGLLACDMLMRLDRHAEPQSARDALNELRLAGATKELRLAARKLAADGPARAVTVALADVDLTRSTRTTAAADLALLRAGGHLADAATASRAIEQLLATVGDPEPFFTRTTASTGLALELVETLAGVLPAADDAGREAVRDHVLALPAIADQAIATAFAKVVNALPEQAWDEEAATQAAKAADAHHEALALPLLGAAAGHDADASQRLVALAREGSLHAVAALGDVGELPADVAAVLIEQLAEGADSIVSDAHAGTFGMPVFDVGGSLALLNAWHPDHAKWDSLLLLLDDDAVLMSAKRESLRVLESLADRVPPEVRDPLIPIASRIARREVPETLDFFGAPGDAAGEATNLLFALGAVDPDESAERLVEFLGGAPADRRWAARVAARAEGPETLGLLAALAGDADPEVRAAAAAGLASAVARGGATSLADRALRACIEDPGTAVPMYLVGALRAAGGETASALLAPLREHPSAYVREAATRDR
jgi:hypothetical protein